MKDLKWIKGASAKYLLIFLPSLIKHLRFGFTAVFLICIFTAGLLTADSSSMSVRIFPGYYFPVDDPVFQPGLGTAAAFDFTPLPFLSIFAQGEYVNIGLENIESLALTDGSIGAGLLWRMNDRLSLRTDLMTGIYSVSRNESTISGLSGGTRIEGTYHVSPVLSTSVYGSYRHFAYTPEPFMKSLSIGIGISINLKEALSRERNINAEKESQDPVFPVLYSWYDDNPFSIFKITNNEKNTITDVRTSFYLEQYMGQPKLCAAYESLKPGEAFDVPVSAFFSESMLELSEAVNTQAQIIVEYRRLGAKQKAVIPVSMNVFHRNAMSWEDDRRAAAFVSSKDPAALWFSKYVSSIVSDRFRKGINRNIQYSMGVFEALDIYGINYVIDPSSSYADLADNSTAIDFLQYPYQTLMYRGGDCDDLSILYCSLLEAIGIDTAFVTIPGHIFMAFSTGMTEQEAKESFYAPELLIYHDGIAWVPLEITLIKEDFNKAWRIGAKEWNDADSRGTANIYPMKESWKIYKPVSIPGAASRFNLPDENKTALAFDNSLNTYAEREIRPQIRTYEELLVKSDTPENRNRLGVLYGKYGMLTNAKTEFTSAAKNKDINAWINLGNILFLEQKYSEALTYYTYVLSIDKNNSLALLGAARCYYELDEYAKSDALYAALKTRDSQLATQYAYLGSFYETSGRAWSLADRLDTTTWSLPSEKKAIAAAVPAEPEPPADDGPDDEEPAEEMIISEEKTQIAIAEVDTPTPTPEPAPAAGLSSMLSVIKKENDTDIASIQVLTEPQLPPELDLPETEPEHEAEAQPEPEVLLAAVMSDTDAVPEVADNLIPEMVEEEAEEETIEAAVIESAIEVASAENEEPAEPSPEYGLRAAQIDPDVFEIDETAMETEPAVSVPEAAIQNPVPVKAAEPAVKKEPDVKAASPAEIAREAEPAPEPAPTPVPSEEQAAEETEKPASSMSLLAFISFISTGIAAVAIALYTRSRIRLKRKIKKPENKTAEKKKNSNRREGTDYDKTH